MLKNFWTSEYLLQFVVEFLWLLWHYGNGFLTAEKFKIWKVLLSQIKTETQNLNYSYSSAEGI